MHSSLSPDDLFKDLAAAAQAFMQGPGNDMGMPSGPEPAFGTPLLGCVAGDDSLWRDFKTHVGPFHWTPQEAFEKAFPGSEVSAAELSVLSWILPQTEATKKDQRKERELPCERWARSRVTGESKVHAALYRHMVAHLAVLGIEACAPELLADWSRMDSDTYVFASTWSERHAAYAAGLGTFGLCDGLITPLGKAMRTGAIVLRHALPATPRPYTDHHAYCLFFSKGACNACIRRCPAGAISEAGHDKIKCKNYTRTVTQPYSRDTFGMDGPPCGLCQVGVPCESRIPGRKSA